MPRGHMMLNAGFEPLHRGRTNEAFKVVSLAASERVQRRFRSGARRRGGSASMLISVTDATFATGMGAHDDGAVSNVALDDLTGGDYPPPSGGARQSWIGCGGDCKVVE